MTTEIDPTVYKLDNIASEFVDEYLKAKKKFPKFRSNHEGYAVIKEEVDELWDEIKKKNESKERMREEAIQIGAMTLGFIYDLLMD